MTVVAIPTALAGGVPIPPPPGHTQRMIEGETMGTTWRATLFADPVVTDAELREEVEGELSRVVSEMSHWREDSDLTRFGRAAAGEWVELPGALIEVLESGLAIWSATGGAFDPAIAPLVDAWGFGPAGGDSTPPSEARVAAARARGDASRLRLDLARRRLLQPGGVSLDLSAIAKGFAVDVVVKCLIDCGVSSCLVDIGGEMGAQGVKPDGQPWWVGVECPPDAGVADFPVIRIALCGLAIATSGPYRRRFEYQGTVYNHAIDPRTGAPVQNSIVSVTVLHLRCMFADAYSTALFVMGPEEGLSFADRHGLAAAVVVHKPEGGYELLSSRLFAEMIE